MDSILQRWQPQNDSDARNNVEAYYTANTREGPLYDINGFQIKCHWTYTYPQFDPLDYVEPDDSDRPARLASALLSDACKSPGSHNVDMDQRLAKHILCRYSESTPSWQTIYKARSLLSRLPREPPTPTFMPFKNQDRYEYLLTAEYFVPGHDMGQNARSQFGDFGNLRVVSMMDGLTTQLALLVAETQQAEHGAAYVGFQIRRCMNQLAQTLDAVLDISESRNEFDPVIGRGLKIVVALLWTVWQRSVTLYLAWVLDFEIRAGSSTEDFLVLRYPRLLSDTVTLGRWAGHDDEKSPYMCPWALQLLQTSKASLAFDYRTLKRRFQEAHKSREARCTIDHQTCKGTSPTACGRFTEEALRIPDQAVHSSCKGCSKIRWDERSYRKVHGGRAVNVSKTSSRVRYCQAGTGTMAISHVWAHGQGGRPDTGMNRCLHERYCRLAKSQGCDSYWIDTLCIPDAHDLRKEAINNINETFSSSKLTLVCDRDLMAISKSGWKDVAKAERLLATLLVCDWNVRAWTMFESIRGRQNLHILCAKEQIVSVKSLVQIVLSAGATDLAVIALAARHTLPRIVYRPTGLSESSSLLSHRHATREGDDILIWSLMCGGRSDQHTSDPERFWTSSVGRFVNTGFLLSTAPRLENVKYFRWAPRSPNVRFEVAARSADHVFSSDGEGSEVGRVTVRGLDAIWLVHPVWPLEIQRASLRKPNGQSRRDESFRAQQALAREEQNERFPLRRQAGWINPCFEALEALRTQHRRLCMLKPKATGRGEYRGSEELKRLDSMVVVAYSDSLQPQPVGEVEDQWVWAGVYEWPREAEMSEGDWERILLQ